MNKKVVILLFAAILSVSLFAIKPHNKQSNLNATIVEGEIAEVVNGRTPIMKVELEDSGDIVDVVIKRSGDYYKGLNVKVWYDGMSYYQDLENTKRSSKSLPYGKLLVFSVICLSSYKAVKDCKV